MENYKKIFTTLMFLLAGFFVGFGLADLSIYLLNLPNTIANILGVIVASTIFGFGILLGHKIVKSLNK